MIVSRYLLSRSHESSHSLQVNARLGEYVGVVAWNKTTSAGATIKTALDFAMTTTTESSTELQELYPDIAAVASEYGDPDHTYTKYLASKENSQYVTDANFFWNQPLYDSGYASSLVKSSTASGASRTSKDSKPRPTGSSIMWDPSAPTSSSTNGARGSASVRDSWQMASILVVASAVFWW